MPASTTLLISADPSLIKSVEGVVASVDHLRLEVVSEIDDASDPLSQEGLVLVLAHLTAGQDTDEVLASVGYSPEEVGALRSEGCV